MLRRKGCEDAADFILRVPLNIRGPALNKMSSDMYIVKLLYRLCRESVLSLSKKNYLPMICFSVYRSSGLEHVNKQKGC